MRESLIPFCGLPPLPAEIWQRWTLDPVLLAALALLLAGAAVTARQGNRTCRVGLLAGWSVLALALASPLCALSVALFSARAAQHMLLLVVAAPLLAIGFCQTRTGVLPRIARWLRLSGSAAFPALLFAALLWAWHVPALYEATFRSDLAYWAMHVSLLAAALPLWMQILHGGRALSVRVLAGFATFVQMGLLGALLTLAPAVLYTSHLTTTQAWGLSPLMDQQLGGLIMWVPGCGAVLLALLWALQRAFSAPAAAPAG